MKTLLARFEWLVAAAVITVIAVGLALLVPTARQAESSQGLDEFIVSATDAAIDPTTGEAVVQVSVKRRTTDPAAVRGSLGYNTSAVQLISCEPIDPWVSCAEQAPGIVVFEAVTGQRWIETTPLLALTFDAGSITSETLVDLEIDAAFDDDIVPIGARAGDGTIAPHDLGDANCDTAAGIVDALIISQYTVGTRTDSGGCPIDTATELFVDGADMTGDGVTNIVDALVIAQCTVGLDNGWCD